MFPRPRNPSPARYKSQVLVAMSDPRREHPSRKYHVFFFLLKHVLLYVYCNNIYIYHKLYVYIRSKWNAATMTLGCLTGRLEKSDLSEEALLHSTPLLSPATLEANLVRAHASRRWFPIRTRRQYAYLPICYCCLLWSIRLRKS